MIIDEITWIADLVFSLNQQRNDNRTAVKLDECTRNDNQQNEQYEDYTCTCKQASAATAANSTQFSHCDFPPFAVYI